MTQITSPIRSHNVVRLRSSDSSTTSEQDPFSFCAILNVLAFVLIVAIVNEWCYAGLASHHLSLSSCAHSGSSTPSVEIIAIAPKTVREFATIHEHQYRTLQHHFSIFINGENTIHDYSFLLYLVDTYGDCRPILQVGDFNPAITLALSSTKNRIQVFHTSTNDVAYRWNGGLTAPRFRGRNVQWTRKLLHHQLDVQHVVMDEILSSTSVDAFRNHMLVSWLIVVSGVQRNWMQRLLETHAFFGIVIIDRIHTSDNMRLWWSELLVAQGDAYQAYDVTSISNMSGTGILDFSHRVHLMIDDDGDENKQLAIIQPAS